MASAGFACPCARSPRSVPDCSFVPKQQWNSGRGNRSTDFAATASEFTTWIQCPTLTVENFASHRGIETCAPVSASSHGKGTRRERPTVCAQQNRTRPCRIAAADLRVGRLARPVAQRSFPGAFRRPSVARRGLTGKLPCSLSRHESELRASLIFRRTVPSRKVLLQPRAAAASPGRDAQHGGTTISQSSSVLPSVL